MKRVVIMLVFLLGISLVSANSDVSVFQGQYYEDSVFQEGTYTFTFVIYDNSTGGNEVYSFEQELTTGQWGEWRIELEGISAAANDTSKDYFMDILIDGASQGERKRITNFYPLRKNVLETTSANFTIGNSLHFALGGILEEWVNAFSLNKNVEVKGNLSASGDVCTANRCLNSLALEVPVMFESTVNAQLRRTRAFLPLGTSTSTGNAASDASWIIGENLTLTEILWNANSNARSDVRITVLKSSTNKNSFQNTTATAFIDGTTKGSATFSGVNFTKGDLMLIEYTTTVSGTQIVDDLSITLVGHYA